jgi:hypothetical protein
MYNDSFLKIDSCGNKYWRNKDNKFHRLYAPAIELVDGHKEWYLKGKRHRLDGPAAYNEDGYEAWYLEGKLHRLDGPALQDEYGYKAWYKNELHHREDGPAVINKGKVEWWIEGRFYMTKENYFDALPEYAKIKCLFSEDFING